MKKIASELILIGIGFIATFWVWIVISIYSIQAKADRVVAVEEKIDYIYKYLIEKNKEN